jgi:Ni/Co efflux regulator RcnB
MNLARIFTTAIIVAAMAAAVPAAAQERRSTQDRARQSSQSDDRQRARAQRRTDNRERARPAPAPRRPETRADRGERRVAPRGSDNRSYRGNDRRYYAGPRAVPRPRYSRPYYYSRPYVRPYRHVPYRPFYFSQRYYTFRPHLHLGFGLWIGAPVPYPYRYLGSYRPRVYGYAASVSIYGGVSFDIRPRDADLFVNGEYVGQVGDFNPYSEPLTLTPGVHRIAVQREGYRPMEWEVEIQPGQVIPYRGEMERY